MSTTCVIPENQPIYQALLAKADSYPPEDKYKAAAYRTVADEVAALDTNLYSVADKPYFSSIHIPRAGDSIKCFIREFIKKPVITCVVPENQPIYQALITKAATYPLSEPWKAKAYKKAAESIATYNKNIFKDYELENTCYGIPYVGDSIEEFIYNFINTTTKNKAVAVQSSPAGAASLVPVVPVVPSVVPVVPEDDEVTKAIKQICIEKKATFTPQLIDEFNAWRTGRDLTKYCDISFVGTTHVRTPRSLPQHAAYWAKYISHTLQVQYNQPTYLQHIIKYCKNNNIPYNNDMLAQFNSWMADPANKRHTTRINKWLGGNNYAYIISPFYTVKNWFKTITRVSLVN
jgi:hypothetical protein